MENESSNSKDFDQFLEESLVEGNERMVFRDINAKLPKLWMSTLLKITTIIYRSNLFFLQYSDVEQRIKIKQELEKKRFQTRV